MDRRTFVVVAAIVGTFLLVQVGALALVEPFKSAGFQATEDPSDPTNSLVYVVGILVATAVMLAAFRFGVDGLIRALVVFAAGYITFFVFSVLVPPVATAYGFNLPAGALSLSVVAGLYAYPEWYVIDVAGVVMGMGAAALFGISFGLLPALLLLTVLAVYDAISVYGTEHMLTLASGVMDLKLPVVLVFPLTLSYSFLDSTPPASVDSGEDGEDGSESATTAPDGGEHGGDGTDEGTGTDATAADGTAEEPPESAFERDAFFIGLGDAVMPAVLVASAGFFAPGGVEALVSGLALTLPALTAMVGTVLGLLVLMYQVAKGQAHAGLPLLNGGAIAGYLAGSLVAGVPVVTALGLAPYL
ncbi:MAG: presenilin family intramembrane aspartyl protease PSH [Haloarculaceae archaeon]